MWLWAARGIYAQVKNRKVSSLLFFFYKIKLMSISYKNFFFKLFYSFIYQQNSLTYTNLTNTLSSFKNDSL